MSIKQISQAIIICSFLGFQVEAIAFELVASGLCNQNSPPRKVEYEDPEDLITFPHDLKYDVSIAGRYHRPIWDIRYVEAAANSLTCVDKYLVAEIILNTVEDSEDIFYGGKLTTFGYTYTNSDEPERYEEELIYPFENGGELMLQSQMTAPIYYNFDGHNPIGAQVNYNVFLVHKDGAPLNFVINIFNGANIIFPEDLNVDPTTNSIHVTTSISDSNQFSTKSIYSSESFQRVSITYQNMLTLLAGTGLKPEDFKFEYGAIQYEVSDGAGHAFLWGKFRAFEIYTGE